jgi:uncharacterized protein YhaN
MTTELDALPETEAIRMLSMFIDTAVGTMVTMHTTRIKEVRAELIRLAEENARLRPMLTARSQEMLRLVSESGELKTRAEKAEARVQELERENEILEIKNRGTLANNLCPDHRDKQTGKPCLACTIETLTRKKDRAEAELAAIKRRIAEAPIQMVPCAPTPDGLVNKRMRLLDDEAKS